MKTLSRLGVVMMLLIAVTMHPGQFMSSLVANPIASAATSYGACWADEHLVCSAEDVKLSNPSVTIIDGCDGSIGDTATISLTSNIIVQGGNRYDIGIRFGSDGTSPLVGFSCIANSLPIGLGLDDGDACGDLLQGTHNNQYIGTFIVDCKDTNGDGNLNLPYCTSWQQNNKDVCVGPSGTIPGSPSKCKCDNEFEIPVVVPDEVCDGRDNDRDGLVDELFPDTDNDGIADCVDTCDYSNLNGTTCTPTSPNTNACGVVGNGTYNCDGVCIANPAPALPTTYGQACTSDLNMCGGSNTGTIGCDGLCNATIPANPSFFGQPCNGPANACGAFNVGTLTCTNTCTVTSAPANPNYLGQTCSKESAANACGEKAISNGTLECGEICNAPEPVVPANPTYLGQPCNGPANACGAFNVGTLTCTNTCTVTSAPANPNYLGQTCSKESAANACGEKAISNGTLECGEICNAPEPVVPANPTNYGMTCNKTSAANACEATSTTEGTYQCDGSCSAPEPVVPANPTNYGMTCIATGAMNACGSFDTATGTILCDGSCSAIAPSAPANPTNYGMTCNKTSAANACEATSTTEGTYQCDGSCSAPEPVVPANPTNYGMTCIATGAMNACGSFDTATGTILCDGSCSATITTTPANPETYGMTCRKTSPANVCGATSTTEGTYQCDGSCNATEPVVPIAIDSDSDGTPDCKEMPDVTLTKTVNLTTAFVGNTLTYTIAYSNIGGATGSNITITDTLPAGVTFISASHDGVYNNGTITRTVPMLAPGSTGSFTVQVTPTTNGSVVNTATTSSSDDVNTGNNTSSVTTTIYQLPTGGGGGGTFTVIPLPTPFVPTPALQQLQTVLYSSRVLDVPFSELLEAGADAEQAVQNMVILPKTGA